jgi:hypothetical protein
MASINYQWLGVSGEVHFPEGTGLNDVGVFAINGDLSLSSFADELSEAKYLNRGNLPLALDYTQPVTPGQVITALGIWAGNVRRIQACKVNWITLKTPILKARLTKNTGWLNASLFITGCKHSCYLK